MKEVGGMEIRMERDHTFLLIRINIKEIVGIIKEKERNDNLDEW